jgi:hypothetical protein
MPLLEAIKSLTHRLSALESTSTDAVIRIKGYMADKALVCDGDSSTEFLRRLNRCETLQEVWALRTEFYNILARNSGELEAMRHTDAIQEMFSPFIDRGKIKGASTRGPNSRSHERASRNSSFGPNSRQSTSGPSSRDSVKG